MKEKMEGERVAAPDGGVVGEGTQQVVRPEAIPSDTIDDVNGNPTDPDTQLQTSKGGPRLITINRTDQGFGFTLRHFIVYPPELSELLGEHGEAPEPLSSLDPLDTIFVKHVRPGSSAHLAGLRTGDRVVSVNGESVGSRTYQEVVATIYRSPPTLQLLVVPREQDLLQQVFGETAHNPESNLDVRMPSPSHLPPQHLIHYPTGASLSQPPLAVPPSHYPASLSSAWSSQSSLNSHQSAMSTGAHPATVIMAHPPFHQRPHQSPKVMQPHGAHIPIHPQSSTPTNQAAVQYWPGPRKHSLSSGGVEKQGSGSRKQSLPGSADRRQAVHTIQNTLSAVPLRVPSTAGKQSPLPPSTNTPSTQPNASSNEPSNASVFGVYEPILDRAMGGRGSIRDSRRLERDPDGRIYEVVQTRVIESKLNNTNDSKRGNNMHASQGNDATPKSHHGRKTSAVGEADAKRVRVQSLSPPRLKSDQVPMRSVSVHTQPDRVDLNTSQDGSLYGSQQSISSTKSESHNHTSKKHNLYTRRSLTEPLTGTREGNGGGSGGGGQSNDKSTQEVINRIKKNVERKEEFLKRPNQPIWLPASKAPVIHTDYHVNPQKFQKPLWPPPQAQTPPSPGSITKALSCLVGTKHDTHPNELNRRASLPTGEGKLESDKCKKYEDCENQAPAQNARSLVGNAVPKPYVGSPAETSQANTRYGKGFTSTLSRIQENIPIPEHGSNSSLASRSGSKQGDGSLTGTPTGSERSLSSGILRPVPLAWVGDNERIKQLQIVSKRAKQFENSQLEKETPAKSAFHRFELSRLSQRTKIPNVAQRKQEFEKKDDDQQSPGFEFEFGTQYNNVPRQRNSAELVRSVVVSKEMSPSPPKVFRSLSDGGSVFPVSRRLYSPGYDKSSPPPSGEEEETVRYCTNRVIPIGGPHIHCEPPPHMSGARPQSDSDVLERERSNSICSQASMSSLWSTQSMEEGGTTRSKGVVRQNSYLNAVHSPLSLTTPTVPTSSAGTVAGVTVVTSAITSTGATTTTTSAVTTTTPRGPTAASDVLVSRRNKALYGEEGERVVRRVSYLKATSGDRMYSDSDLDSDTDDKSGGRVGVVGVPLEGDVDSAPPNTPADRLCLEHPPSPESFLSSVDRQGTLHVKVTLVDGKRAGDRSWKTLWVAIQGRAIIFYKDRQHAMQTPLGVEEQISLRGAEVEVATDYTKRRNVLRLATPGGSQLLLQADTPPEMLAWLSTLHNNCAIQEGEGESKAPMNNNISPQTGNKAMRKLTSLRTRSPTGQSPSIKTRKPGGVESNTSPKSKNWRGHLKRPFMKKVQSGSPAATPTLPEGATIGVCLEDCPQSLENEFVPLLVALCVGVVESRGLQTQGIYRIPGNKASVTYLTEMINKDAKSIDYDDARWCDVNVISSMLKQFFQKLPDPLFTCELYPHFIEASKVEDPKQRMLELKKLIHELPDHHYETLRFLLAHLNNIVTNSDFNKMDVRNLAIVFGPTLVRSGDDNMVTMVTDMSHQCRIVETLISHSAWFFSEDEGEQFSPPIVEPPLTPSPAADGLPLPAEMDTPSSRSLLLDNIQKVEGNIKGDMKKDIVSSIISAANRKVHKAKHKKPMEDKPVDESKFIDRDGGFEERDIDKEAELRKQRLIAKQMESMVELPDPKPMSERKISNMSLMSVQSHMSGESNESHGERTSGGSYKLGLPGDDPRLYSVAKKDELVSSPIPLTLLSNSSSMAASVPSQQSSQFTPETSSLFGDEVAIRSYAGLSASTQERIRKFEMETRAMLHRDLTRHRRETERRDAERQRIEEELQRAKQDMESEDLLDQLADNPSEVVRKISDYSWRLQDLSGNVGGQRGSLVSQGSTTSSQAALISAALSHHPLSNTSFTPTTNATTQVPNNHLHPPIIKIVNEPAVGKATDSNEYRHGMLQQNSLAWLDYNTASPHSTLGSTSSSSSSGYGSLTRPSNTTNRGETEDTSARSVDEAFSLEPSVALPKSGSTSQCSSPSNTKKKKSSKGHGFFFGLTSSSSSPSLFPSMSDAATELTPTRKIGQTTIYPESPRPPPHKSHTPSPSHLTVPASTLTPQPNTPVQGRHKDSILHHILPSRLYHSPRPLRRGSSAENVTQPLINPTSPSTFDTQKVVNNGTLKRARTSREQILNGPEQMPRCGSLDSLRDGPHVPHDDGSDLLSAITATFEEKMRSLQESSLGLVTSDCSDSNSSQDSSPEDVRQLPEQPGRGNSGCRLYRDPSLHRRRTSPRTSVTTPAASTASSHISQVEDSIQSSSIKESDYKVLTEDKKPGVKVKRTDSLTKSEKTENNLKEKTEKRSRELKRTDTQESLNEKRPKEMKRSDLLEGRDRLQETSKKSDTKENASGPTRRSSDLRSRRHNVKELKEKFEQNTGSQTNTSPMKPSNNLYSSSNSSSSNKGSKSGIKRSNYRGPIKRRHTVGGTKDLAKWAWIHSVEMSKNALRATRPTAWERLQPLVVDERLNTDRSLEAWLTHERIRTSSPDLSRPQQLVLPCIIGDKENLHRRLSVQEAALNPLYPVLESHV
ncbi:rho GTPase-activating protein 21-B-like isoform X5 [Portunus trituberculatus]|uniref:rho GTPase-activating protein 21-B-like isoform X5 n=1 Tax=Portunus trituberculatus TaxID=210409 RepID=UPI001E1CDE38|nr:rho GTPase-activating protein 21-B-like isoform X5 [Portunus trituberculatus]